MTDATLTQLKMLVERTVRPVRAGPSRKKKIREELLAHVTAVFEEEAAQLGDDPALARTIARFGSAAEVTDQLQSTIGIRERLLCAWEKRVGFAANTPHPWRAFQHTFRVGAMYLLFGSMIVLGVQLAKGVENWSAAIAQWGAILWLCFILTGFVFLSHCMQHAIYEAQRRRALQVVLLCVLSCLLTPVATFLLRAALWSKPWAPMKEEVWSTVRDSLSLLPPTAVLTPLGLFVMAYGLNVYIREHRDWENLEIE